MPNSDALSNRLLCSQHLDPIAKVHCYKSSMWATLVAKPFLEPLLCT